MKNHEGKIPGHLFRSAAYTDVMPLRYLDAAVQTHHSDSITAAVRFCVATSSERD